MKLSDIEARAKAATASRWGLLPNTEEVCNIDVPALCAWMRRAAAAMRGRRYNNCDCLMCSEFGALLREIEP